MACALDTSVCRRRHIIVVSSYPLCYTRRISLARSVMFSAIVCTATVVVYYILLSVSANRKCVSFWRHIDCIPDINIYVWMCDALFFFFLASFLPLYYAATTTTSSFLLFRSLNVSRHKWMFIILYCAACEMEYWSFCTAIAMCACALSLCTHLDINFIIFITFVVCVCVYSFHVFQEHTRDMCEVFDVLRHSH